MAKGRNKIRQKQRKSSPWSSVSLEQPRDDAQGSGSPRAEFSPLLSPAPLLWLFSPHHSFIQGMEKREGTGCSQKSRKAAGVGREGERGECFLGKSRSVSPWPCPGSRILWDFIPFIPQPFPASHTCARRFSSPSSDNEGKVPRPEPGILPLHPTGANPAGCGNRWDPSLERCI